MKNILYFTGAGFSAPLGIPVMSNFVQKSKDLYQEDNVKYADFSKIFALIDDLSKIKLHIELDLRNIEDIFSLLEMKHFIEGNSDSLKLYKKYIEDTITSLTPTSILKENIENIGNWQEFWITYKDKNDFSSVNIASFIKYLCGIDLGKNFVSGRGNVVSSSVRTNRNYKYSLVTLNYDLFPELCIDFINENYPNSNGNKYYISSEKDSQLQYIKLHGSVGGNINLPSWNKVGNAPESQSWKAAFELLKDANEIRILGYSLPDTDAYVKYLFGIALRDSFNLQKIDVITLDSDGKTKERFTNIFENSKILRFREHGDLNHYMSRLFTDNVVRDYWISDQIFENRHESFMTDSSY
ncbi:hypothetical protein ACQV5M_18720 [Leptospira sp. SA-E8]|uniref:hypothetical protein n=1 Tax=Leptospira sp. SA-E8 TaxID=3422259 RepID=UPI003EBA1CC1